MFTIDKDINFTRYDGTKSYLTDFVNEMMEEWQAQVVEENTKVDITQPEAFNLLYIMCLMVFDNMSVLNDLRVGININTAENLYLDDMGARVGIYRQEATFAQGQVTFTLDSALQTQLLIPGGTMLSTEDTIIFATDEDLIINPGQTSGTVNIIALDSGDIGNVLAGTIVNINDDLGVVGLTVNNTTATSGGIEEESDESYRARIIDSNLNYPVGTARWFEKVAEQIVIQAKFTSTVAGEGTIVYHAAPGFVVSDLINLFNEPQYNDPAVALVFVSATGTDVLSNVTITLHLDTGIEQTVVENEINTLLEEYCDSISIGGIFLEERVKQYVESVDGVLSASYTNLEDVQLGATAYAAFAAPTYSFI